MCPGPPRLLLGLSFLIHTVVVAAVLVSSSSASALSSDVITYPPPVDVFLPAPPATSVLSTLVTLAPEHALNQSLKPSSRSGGVVVVKKNLTVGYLAAVKGELKGRQGLAISGALTIALEEVNNDPDILPNVNLVMRYNDTQGDPVIATRAMTDMICDGVAVFFGPEGSCQVESIVAQSRNIPMISYKCSDYFPKKIPTFARTEPPDTQVTKSVISLLQYYKWEKFSIVYEQAWSRVATELGRQSKERNLTINHNKKVSDQYLCCVEKLDCCLTSFWYDFIKDTKNHTRIYVFLGTPNMLIEIMDQMQSQQLFDSGEYMVIYVDMMTYSEKEALKYIWKSNDLNTLRCNVGPAILKRARSLLVVVATPPDKKYNDFVDKVNEYNKKEPFNFGVPTLFKNSSFTKYVSNYAAYLYDSVKLYAQALDYLLKENGNLTDKVIEEIASNGTRIIETIINNRTYQSVTGATIKLDNNGDSEGNFSVLAWKPAPNPTVDFKCAYQMMPVATFLLKGDLPEYKLISSNSQIDWPGGQKPIDEPSCGFEHQHCTEDGNASKVAAGILAVILFCASVITLSIYRKWKIEQEIEGLLWKIDPQDLHGYFGNDIVSSPSKLSLMSATSYESRCGPQVFATTGLYKGVMVRIKELKFSKKKDIARDVMKEMRLLRDIRHDNINSFIGACLEPMRVLIITDYCAKGSLYDIVENEDIRLDMMFIASLVHDLVKGMLFIHSSVLNCHGNLKSSNCVVTSRWVLQITDFGIHELRHCAENDSIGEHQYYRNLLWKAPELLRHPHAPLGGSQKGDVYAFGIILYEIIGRKGPFGSSPHEPKDIVSRVKNYIPGEVPFRPDLDLLKYSETGCSDYIQTCIQDCWGENPELRPDFYAIRSRLKKMKEGMHRNIMDQMMDMMEKYANNLEDLVGERTRLLYEEKLKTEGLLHRMLPLPVANKLTNGVGVEPETFDLVTIYFSDIVGFTAMSAESSPLQVVNFLNDLYTLFDRIIKGYDVYKVETIGDAYMVVSGLPLKNGDLHAGEIASMSLDLLEGVKNHRIAHRPCETLKLRIGVHTGPVVAGVVGLTMPRYCLFGDTVNTASRMESNGEPLKIHISPQCRDALVKIGGYIMEERGLVEMKGKGAVKTYWLVGATDKAVQRREVDLGELPPLFSRPRRSPRLMSDSRQASICGGFGAGSRRQSSVPRGTGADLDSTSTVGINCSPLTRIKRPQLHLTETLSDAPAFTVPVEPPPLAPPPPQAMREARSLDPFPEICNKQLETPHLSGKRSCRSLENCTRDGPPGGANHTPSFPNGNLPPMMHDDTGLGSSAEDVQVPLLGTEGNEARVIIGNCRLRQGRSSSETFPEFFPTKRWRSLEEIPGNTSPSIETRDKKILARGSIRSWLVGLFNANGLRTSDASLRKGIHGGFGDIQLEKESIV